MKTSNWDTVQSLHGTHTRVIVMYETIDRTNPITGEYFVDVEATCVIIKPEEGLPYVGVAIRSPSDSPNKNLGREIAAGRALKDMVRDMVSSGEPGFERNFTALYHEDKPYVVVGSVPSELKEIIASRLAHLS